MTIINAFVADDHALIGCDTECKGDDGTIHAVAKMLPLPHIGAVLAVAGTLLYANKLMGIVHMLGADFDQLLSEMPNLLPAALATTQTAGELMGVKFQNDPKNETVFLVGYSPREQRMIGRYWHNFEQREISPCVVHPSFHTIDSELTARLEALPRPDNLAAMAAMAKEQVSILREHAERMPKTAHGGGAFIVAGITERGMAIQKVCEL